jgi:hypothetical protein
MTLTDIPALFTPRALIGHIRAVRRPARITVAFTTADGRRTCAIRVSKAEALRQVRRLYCTGAMVSAYDAFGELVIG